MARTTPELRRRLEEAAAQSGRSLGQEVEFRLMRDVSWEDSKRDIDQMRAQAEVAVSAAHIQAIREAGLQIVREAGGGDVTVNVSLELLNAEADGIIKSGFVDPEADARDGRWQRWSSPAKPKEDDLEETIYRAVTRALRDAGREDPAT